MDSEQETAARADLDVLMEQMRGYPPTRIAEAMWGWMEAQGFREKADTREVQILRNTVKDYDTNFPCDGGCNTNDGPEETCSRHGRSPRDLWNLLDAARRPEPQGEPSDAPKRLVHEVNMILSSVASHGPAALTDTSDRMYTTGLLRRLRDALDPKPAHRLAAGNAVRAEMARNGLDVHRMVYGQEIANVLAGAALDAALRAAGGAR